MGPCAGVPSNKRGKSLQVQNKNSQPVINNSLHRKQENQRNIGQKKSQQDQIKKGKQVQQKESLPSELGSPRIVKKKSQQ